MRSIGGVDSSVVALLINKAIKKIILYHGRYRTNEENEFKFSYKIFKYKYKLNVKLINASSRYYKKLRNIKDPEKKGKLLEIYL